VILFLCPAISFGENATINATFDRWNYPFNASPGSRLTGSTFGAVGNPAFDDRDAQIILGFDMAAAGIPSGAEVTAVSVQLTTSTDNAFEYDPTYDAIATYVDPTLDMDIGRPVELYGLGLRNGFVLPAFDPSTSEQGAFDEGEAFAFGNPAARGARNAFMSDYFDGPRDISNNVADGIELLPWAVGTIEGLLPADAVPLNAVLSFDVDLSNPNVLGYVEDGLSSGGLFFTVSSMHSSAQGSSAGIPSFFLGDANLPDLELPVAQLQIAYQVVAEPAASSATLFGIAAIVLVRRRRRAFGVS